MKDPVLVERIRKLLRLAKNSNDLEGALAAERAKDLMNKHGIEVSLNDVVRQEMPGVGGVFWKEKLLLTLARPRRCRMLASTQDQVSVVLAGERKDVERVGDLYLRYAFEIILSAAADWETFLDAICDGYDDITTATLRKEYDHHNVMEIWMQVVCEHASRALVVRLEKDGPKPPPEKPKPADLNLISRTKELPKKIEGLAERLERVIKIIGVERAGTLYQAALQRGMTTGEQIEVLNEAPGLMQESSIEPDDATMARCRLLEIY